jgi:hypothetical protein
MGLTGQIGQSEQVPTAGSPLRTSPAPGRRLDSWKAIAQYLGRDVRSVQRWERDRGLPIHRLPGQKGGAVFAYENELSQWLRSGSERADTSALPTFETHPSPRVENESAATPSLTSSGLASRKWLLAALLLIGVLLLAWQRHGLPGFSRPLRSIAVLPLQNLSRAILARSISPMV